MAEVNPAIEITGYILLAIRLLVVAGLVTVVLYKFRVSHAGVLISLSYMGSIVMIIARMLVFTVGLVPHEKGGDVHGYLVLGAGVIDAVLVILLVVGIGMIPRALQRRERTHQ